MNTAPFSSLASWNEMEKAVDRWVSLAALAVAGVAIVVFVLIV